ncbi:hypothetical protein [Alcanivorax sp.]|uniref:hypothetical protein n=1 Tax=Alcanivorax sp. TaxID=1872427 RepID=UPI0025C5AE84|nr:hypothetical protein [Alcanivorax sp.]
MSVVDRFEEWGAGYSGCDGGDIGNPDKPSVWVCGIEWGGGHSPVELEGSLLDDVSTPPPGYSSWQENLAYIFNWQVMKILSAISGGSVEEYKSFAENNKPFVGCDSGYFKMNLYPIGFKDTSQKRWIEDFEVVTGFGSKFDYLEWCSECRFPQIRGWAKKYKPKLILCLGKSYADDFLKAFHEEGAEFNTEIIDDRELRWVCNSDGALVVVVPFMVNANGLVRNASIQRFGDRVYEILVSI